MEKKIVTIRDVNLKDKCVFVRVDFNVPLNEKGEVSDDTRIVRSLPTITYLLEQNCKVILASHMGRPKGSRNLAYSLQRVAPLLAKHLMQPVIFAEDCIGESTEKLIKEAANGSVILLENLRFYAEEEKNDASFASSLGKLAEVYVNDAFGCAHRAHASTVGITQYLSPCVGGLLMEQELTFLGEKTENPESPFVVILGGAKVSDKIKVIDALLDKADIMLIGGAMAYTFALASGKKVGNSLVEPDKIDLAKQALEKAEKLGVPFLLPIDNVITDTLSIKEATVGNLDVTAGDIPTGWEGIDIGPKTVALFQEQIAKAKTLLWNGPMGVFEVEAAAKGTFAIAKSVAQSAAISIIGGGDSVKAIKQSGYAGNVTFISTGGGASLEFLEGKTLPGVAALQTFSSL